MNKITVFNNANFFEIEFSEDMNLLDLIRNNDIEIQASCGGNGTCGKCIVNVDGELVKACLTIATNGMTIYLNEQVSSGKILTHTENVEFEIEHIIPEITKGYGLAVDIGTTTVAAYLYDIFSGKRIGIASAINPQKIFGADVISRIDFTMKGKTERDRMHAIIAGCIEGMIDHLAIEFLNKFKKKLRQALSIILFTGNTTMMHFLLNLDASGIAVAPFTPESTEMHMLPATEIGLNLSTTTAIILPAVSAYVGADTISAIIATSLYKSEKPSLLVDIGTNGEIALKSGDTIWACSTAAGPAFEGANITFGMPAVEGAISKAWIEKDEIKFETIGDSAPKGFCGSGVLDMVALMLEIEVIDVTGRLVDKDELSEKWIVDRIVTYNNSNAFKVSGEILITQKDVREIQNAKAAICAGIKILVERAEIELSEISQTFLAGGFGNFMDKLSATKIGLIPMELEESLVTVGNAAGLGASMALLNKGLLDLTVSLSKTIKYVELSYDPDFVNCYVENMMFGDE